MSKKIIVIEDDPDILDIMTYILIEEGYIVVASSNAKPLEEVHMHQPALILLDDRLLEGFGRDFCRKFKTNAKTRQFPIILMSANPGVDDLARKSLADGYLAKPFDITVFIDLVKQFV
jgi:DNA-binding response OmpR family regulator